MTARALGSSSPAALLNPVKPSMATTSTRSRQDSPRAASQVLRTFLTAARGHVQQASRSHPVAHGGQVDDDGDIAVAPPGVAPHRGGTSRTRAKRAGESSTPRTSTPSKR